MLYPCFTTPVLVYFCDICISSGLNPLKCICGYTGTSWKTVMQIVQIPHACHAQNAVARCGPNFLPELTESSIAVLHAIHQREGFVVVIIMMTDGWAFFSFTFIPAPLHKPQLQILTMWGPHIRDIEAPSRPIIISSTACRRDTEIGIAILRIRSGSPPKRGPNDIQIFPSPDWSV